MTQDVVIVGGGLNGCTMALALAQGGLPVSLLDAQSQGDFADTGFDGRSYALSAASVAMLRVLGVWDHVAEHAAPMHEIKVTDGTVATGPGPFWMHFEQSGPGPIGHVIEDRHLRRGLMEAVGNSEISHQMGTRVADHQTHETGVQVRTSTGELVAGAVLIAADGKMSPIAARAGIRHMRWGYDQTSLVCAIGHERPHDGIAHQFFLPSGPLAILPLQENVSGIVWTEAKDKAAEIQAATDAEYLEILRPRFGDFLGDIQLKGNRYAYPLGLSLADDFIAQRTALIGDAAHSVHPIAGQGLNAGLKDVAALAQVVIDTKRRGEDIGSPAALQSYQRWRRFDVATLAMATDGFNRLFSNDNGLVRGLRGLGMGVVNALPKLRQSFMAEAAGKTGDIPNLLLGRPV